MSDQGERRAKYQRIADELRAAIQAGEYGPGARLPGENDLMSTYGVARMTARQALGVLQDEGLAEARKGAGVYVRRARPGVADIRIIADEATTAAVLAALDREFALTSPRSYSGDRTYLQADVGTPDPDDD